MSYKDANTVVLEANGTGGLSEVASRLREDQCAYFLIRIPLETSETAVAAGADANENGGPRGRRSRFLLPAVALR